MFGRKPASVTINSVDIVAGRHIVINNGTITVDGKDVTPEGKHINLNIVGDIEHLEVDAAGTISVSGNVTTIQTGSGDVQVTGDCHGNIQTASGDVECCDVEGSVQTVSGDVDCYDVGGSITTVSGDVSRS